MTMSKAWRLVMCAGVLAPQALDARTPRLDPTGSPAATVAAISACRAIAASDARLACFDKAAAALDTAIQTHDVTVLDKQQVATTKRSLFGFTIPNIALFNSGKGEDAPENTELDSVITAVRDLGYGHFDITITEDAVWRNADAMDFGPKVGMKIHIKKGLAGNYFLHMGNERTVRGSRVH
jgi:hypothetical protein